MSLCVSICSSSVETTQTVNSRSGALRWILQFMGWVVTHPALFLRIGDGIYIPCFALWHITPGTSFMSVRSKKIYISGRIIRHRCCWIIITYYKKSSSFTKHLEKNALLIGPFLRMMMLPSDSHIIPLIFRDRPAVKNPTRPLESYGSWLGSNRIRHSSVFGKAQEVLNHYQKQMINDPYISGCFMKLYIPYITGWWLGHPSEKY